MLLAVIQHKPTGTLLEIAAEKLTKPPSLFDNNRTILTAGTV
jgi:hypothetical protein